MSRWILLAVVAVSLALFFGVALRRKFKVVMSMTLLSQHG